MSTCKYHPLQSATFRCHHCQLLLCDGCIDEGQAGHHEPHCFLCNSELISLGAANTAEPFWRRFDKAFRYPMAAAPLILIAVLAVLEAVVNQLPIPMINILLSIAVSGALLKYSFSCLENTAEGDMSPPDISAGYGDGIALMLRLGVIMLAMGAAVFGVYRLFGGGIASLLGIASIAVLPAVIILFAMNDSIAEAINPANVLRLITAIGLPYCLLLAIIVLMSGSVGLTSQLIGDNYSSVNQVLNALVSNYYTIVVFHLMGYMLFQYQAELGFTARENNIDESPDREEKALGLAKIRVLIKEGLYDAAAKQFEALLKIAPNDNDINSQYFEFLLGAHSVLTPKPDGQLQIFTSRYLRFLNKSQRHDKLLSTFKRTLAVFPSYLPNHPHIRFLLATASSNHGDKVTALKLLNGLHKEFADFDDLIPAYHLMADILEELPKGEEKAKQCRAFIRALEQRQEVTRATEQNS